MRTTGLADEKREMNRLLEESKGLGRRDFIRTMVVAACGLPVAGTLLAGCSGGSDHVGSGDLQTSLLSFRALLAQHLCATGWHC